MALASILDGRHALEQTIGKEKLLSIVARFTVFLHPKTVAQTHGRPVFRVVRWSRAEKRGSFTEVDGQRVVACDNTTPTNAFLWAAKRNRGTDTQFNHIWPGKRDIDLYTALWNLCVTPAFLAKLTDNHPEVIAALRRRSFDLYGHLPQGETLPASPPGYSELAWAPHPPPADDLEAVYRERLRRAPRSRAATAARECGWLFSDDQPDRLV